jgi:hypothetical protein
MLNVQEYPKDYTMRVFGIGVGDGKEQLSIAAACSHPEWTAYVFFVSFVVRIFNNSCVVVQV